MMEDSLITLVLQWIGIASATAASIAGLWTMVLKPLYQGFAKLKTSLDILQQINEQFSPNGGSTLRDAINRIEARQLIQEQRHKMLSMDAPFAIFETDANGNYIDVNRTYCRWVGRSLSELQGNGWVNCIAPNWQDTVMSSWNTALLQQREFTMKYRLIDTEDESIAVYGTAFPLYDAKKVLVGWVGIIYKVDENIPETPEK